MRRRPPVRPSGPVAVTTHGGQLTGADGGDQPSATAWRWSTPTAIDRRGWKRCRRRHRARRGAQRFGGERLSRHRRRRRPAGDGRPARRSARVLSAAPRRCCRCRAASTSAAAPRSATVDRDPDLRRGGDDGVGELLQHARWPRQSLAGRSTRRPATVPRKRQRPDHHRGRRQCRSSLHADQHVACGSVIRKRHHLRDLGTVGSGHRGRCLDPGP